MKPLEKIQGLSERTRKIILWTVLAVAALILLYFWLNNFQAKLKNLKTQDLRKELNLPELKLPELNLPQ